MLEELELDEPVACRDCGMPAVYIEDEGVWRHKGPVTSDKYFAQTFCDRYGYPVRVEVRKEKNEDSNRRATPIKS